MIVPFLDLAAVHAEMRDDLDRAMARVLDSSSFVLGHEVHAFEEEYAAHVGTAHCVTVGNGLDAIALSLRASGVGPGDEVLVPSHTFIATWLGVSMVGALPVPVEPDDGSYLMSVKGAERALTERTKAVLPVHLYGEPVDLHAFGQMCVRRGVLLVEDAAQAHGATWAGRPVGSKGTATWSFYPGKNLGALGDGGAVTTNDEGLAEELRLLRNYGSRQKYVHVSQGVNSRLDELQAAVLRVKLAHLERHNARRREVADRYLAALSDLQMVLPHSASGGVSSRHLFVVRTQHRNDLQHSLAQQGIGTAVHYPRAVHQQATYAHLGLADADLPRASLYARDLLSLPIGPAMSDDAVNAVIGAVRRWAKTLTPRT